MDIANTPLNMPIEPYINSDGYYPQCGRCFTELDPYIEACPNCQQTQDWSWLSNKNKN